MRSKLIMFAIGTVIGIGSASAADLAPRPYAKAPPMVDPAYNWTGFYIGADVGGAWSRQSANSVSPVSANQGPSSGNLNSDGVVGGVYTGYNWAIAPGLVVGVEGDFSGIRSRASYSGANTLLDGTVERGSISASRNLDWLATARGRLGYSFTPNAMFYVTGGAAWARINYSGIDDFGGGCPACGSFQAVTPVPAMPLAVASTGHPGTTIGSFERNTCTTVSGLRHLMPLRVQR